MADHGKTERDSSGYGFYSVHLRESLRKEIAPVDTAVADSLLRQNDDDDAVVVPEKKPGFFQRLFGKHDTVTKKDQSKITDPKEKQKVQIEKLKEAEKKKELAIDTAGKTPKQLRKEKRALRHDEKDKEKELKDKAGS